MTTSGPYSRAELEEAFVAYQEAGAVAGRTGDWAAWADQFTEDAVYVEHHYGRFEGREAIRAWITADHGRVPGLRHARVPDRLVRGRRGAGLDRLPGA